MAGHLGDDMRLRNPTNLTHLRNASTADWLQLAAAPTFAIMALVAGVLSGPRVMLCSAMPDTSFLSGMTPMYLLMSVFHSAPWLKLIISARGRRGPQAAAP